ncbi:hypothetical protein ACFFX0_06280 [Citricoccus parietis]|uniref:Uncharacterized protein n=1 Tax=Citricoccus parietis TaxID=592307 RepID=A0ABV5FVV7_9MICC
MARAADPSTMSGRVDVARADFNRRGVPEGRSVMWVSSEGAAPPRLLLSRV